MGGLTPASRADVSALLTTIYFDSIIGDPTSPTIDATIAGFLKAASAVTDLVGTYTTSALENTIYEVDRAALEFHEQPFMVEGYIDLANMQAGDTIIIKEYSQAADGTYRQFATGTYTGVQASPLLRFGMKIGAFAYRVTGQQTVGAFRALAIFFNRRRVK